MKVRVAYTTEVDDDFRYALTHSWGECGRLATRQEIRDHLERVGSATDVDLMDEWEQCPNCNPEPAP